MKKIRSSAVRIGGPGGDIFEGRDHGQCYEQILKADVQKSMQGFLTDKGQFVDRAEAAVIAYKCGQIPNDPATDDGGASLISEELWLYGPYKWSKEKGYYK